MPLYLDYNATAPVSPEVLEVIIRTYKGNYGNAGSRTHYHGQRAKDAVRQAREQVATLLGVQTGEVVFTSGATESNNLAILGLAPWGIRTGRKHIVSTAIEHKAVLEPLACLERQGFDVEIVLPDSLGRVRASDILYRVRDDTLLVSVMHANNETGVIQPVAEIGLALKRTPVYFHVDAAQTCGKMVEELKGLHYDLVSVSSHKMYGPQGVGALIIRRARHVRPPLEPLMYGGGQESGLRPGTLPVALVAGFGKAADLARVHHDDWMNTTLRIKESILKQLQELEFVVNGPIQCSLPNCLNVSIRGVDAEALMLALRDEIAISSGSACTSEDYRPSHVLTAMKLPEDVIAGAIRLSWGPDVGDVDLSQLVRVANSFR
ncbi:MAG TPA: cysteine desulfurase DndA [Dissulfurispiraceae bacterium]|nr:cysteine desulfurase DndA [Dissulfurispiraceae bacterium]